MFRQGEAIPFRNREEADAGAPGSGSRFLRGGTDRLESIHEEAGAPLQSLPVILVQDPPGYEGGAHAECGASGGKEGLHALQVHASGGDDAQMGQGGPSRP